MMLKYTFILLNIQYNVPLYAVLQLHQLQPQQLRLQQPRQVQQRPQNQSLQPQQGLQQQLQLVLIDNLSG